jgi:hypothetical protein
MCAGDQVRCDDDCIDRAERNLDQRQLEMPDSIVLSPTQRPGQSFTAAVDGVLTGIEVALGPCNDADASGEIQLELFDSIGNSLGHVRMERGALPDTCGGAELTESAILAGYFDVTELCIWAPVGSAFTFVLSLVGSESGACNETMGTCTNDGSSCESDEDCQGLFNVGVTDCGGLGCESGPGNYAGGSVVMQNPNSGVLGSSPGQDLAFKTFVYTFPETTP